MLEGQVVVTKDGRRFGTKLLTGGVGGEGSGAEGITFVRKFQGHKGPVKQVAFSPDGKLAMSGSGYWGDRTVRLWDVSNGKETRLLDTFEGQVMTVCFSPDGKRAAGGGFGGLIYLWAIETGGRIGSFNTHTEIVDDLEFSPDGQQLLVTTHKRKLYPKHKSVPDQGRAQLWDTKTSELVWQVDSEGWFLTGEFLPGGQGVVVAGCRTGAAIHVLDRKTGRELQRFESSGAAQEVEELDVSQDGRYVATVSQTGHVCLWDVKAGGILVNCKPNMGHLLTASFSPNSRCLMIGGHAGKVQLLDVPTLDVIAQIRHPSGSVWHLAISPDGRHALSAGGHGMISQDELKVTGDYALRLWRLPESVWPTTNEMTEDDLNSLIVEAAGIPNDEWTKLGTDPAGPNAKHVTGTPLSWLLLTLNPNDLPKDAADVRKDFRILTPDFPKPSELSRVMCINNDNGYASIIHPEYITRITITTQGGTARGTVEFEAKGMYAGSVEFAARHVHGKWQIDEFQLPNYVISIQRGADGTWRRSER